MGRLRKRAVRNYRDCYLTTPHAARALRIALDNAGWEPTPVHDPFAGPALLSDVFGAELTLANEIDPMWWPDLRANPRVYLREGDGFSARWGDLSVLTNPPYRLTDAAVEYALETRRRGRFVAMLLRMDWFLHPDRPAPTSLLPLRWRPAFGMPPDKPPRLGSDVAGYAWGVWHDGSRLNLPSVLWLDKPADVRQEDIDRHRALALRVWHANQPAVNGA